MYLIPFARFGGEPVLIFVLLVFEFLGFGKLVLFLGNVWPGFRITAVDFYPFEGSVLCIGDDGFDRAFRLAHPAIDTFIGVNDQHILALVKAIHGADFYTVRVFTFDTDIGHYKSHDKYIRAKNNPAQVGCNIFKNMGYFFPC